MFHIRLASNRAVINLVVQVRELHRDLGRQYKKHATSIESIWRAMNPRQRARCMKAGARNIKVLKRSRDESMQNVCKLIPEWNLKDVVESGPDFLLKLLEFRATTSILEQYRDGQYIPA